MCFLFNQNSESSWQYLTKLINYEQTILLLTKEKYLFYSKLDLYFNELYFSDFALNFSFWISTVNRNCQIGATAAAWPEVFLCKNRKRRDFLNH